MATNHLTPKERLAVKEAEMRARQKAARKTKNRSKSRVVSGKIVAARAEKRRLAALEKDPPPLELVKMYGAAQTELPDSIRPIVYVEDLPDDPFIEELAQQADFKPVMGENISDPRVAQFMKQIGKVENKSMTQIAQACGLSNADMAKMWRNTKLNRAFFRIVNRMSSVADKVVDDALGTKKSCPRCDGFKRIEVPQAMQEFFEGHATTLCPQCEGAGYILNVGSAPDKQLIFEKVGWTKQKGGGINVNLNMTEHTADATMAEMDGIESMVLEHQP